MSACVEARPPGGSSEQAVLQSKKTFPFFKLPRELRDDVYGRCTQRGDLLEMYCDFSNVSDAGVDVAAEPGLRLVSRQFKQEYEEEIARHPGSRSAWIALESAGTPDEEAGDDSEYGPPRDLDALGRLLSNVEVLRVTYRSYELEKDGVALDLQTLLSFMPALKHVEIGNLAGWMRGVDDWLFDHHKTELQLAKDRLLCDSDGRRLGDFAVQGTVNAEFSTFEMNLQHVTTNYHDLVRPGYVSARRILRMFEIHPGRYLWHQLKESNAVHTLHGFEVDDHPERRFQQLSFEEIEYDVMSKVLLHHDADAAPLRDESTYDWRRQLRDYYFRPRER